MEVLYELSRSHEQQKKGGSNDPPHKNKNKKRARKGSNLRHLVPKTSALSTELRTHNMNKFLLLVYLRRNYHTTFREFVKITTARRMADGGWRMVDGGWRNPKSEIRIPKFFIPKSAIRNPPFFILLLVKGEFALLLGLN